MEENLSNEMSIGKIYIVCYVFLGDTNTQDESANTGIVYDWTIRLRR